LYLGIIIDIEQLGNLWPGPDDRQEKLAYKLYLAEERRLKMLNELSLRKQQKTRELRLRQQEQADRRLRDQQHKRQNHTGKEPYHVDLAKALIHKEEELKRLQKRIISRNTVDLNVDSQRLTYSSPQQKSKGNVTIAAANTSPSPPTPSRVTR